MKKFSLTGGWKKLRSDLSKMTWKERFVHLWTYYKVWLLVGLLVVMGLSLITTIIVNKNTTTLASGMLVNIELSEEGNRYLKDDLYEELKKGGWEKVQLNQATLGDLSKAEYAETNYYTIISLSGLAVTGELDYVIMDKRGMEALVAQEMFIDLRDVLTEQELEELGTKVLHTRQEIALENMPTVVNITDIPFVQQNITLEEDAVVYIGFVKGSKRPDNYRLIWERVNNWE